MLALTLGDLVLVLTSLEARLHLCGLPTSFLRGLRPFPVSVAGQALGDAAVQTAPGDMSSAVCYSPDLMLFP